VKLSFVVVLCAGCGGIIVDEVTPAPDAAATSHPDASSYVDVGVPDVSPPPPPSEEAGPDPKTVLVTNAQIMSFAVDDSWVYWTDFSRKVMKVSVKGGAPVTLATQQANPGAIAIDATNVYWSNAGLQTPHTAAIMSIPIGGGTPVQLAECPSSCGDVTVGASYLYWVSDGVNLVRANVDGSNASTIATESTAIHRVVVSENQIMWSEGPDFQLDDVVWAHLDGTSRLQFADDYGIFDVAASGSELFFISSGGGATLEHASAYDVGKITKLAMGSGGGYAGPVAVDDTSVYFSWFGGEGLEKMPLLGGTPVHLTIKVNGYYEWTNGIVLHGSNVYWIGMSGGSQTSINVTPK
jgi:hypothetical protein